MKPRLKNFNPNSILTRCNIYFLKVQRLLLWSNMYNVNDLPSISYAAHIILYNARPVSQILDNSM